MNFMKYGGKEKKTLWSMGYNHVMFMLTPDTGCVPILTYEYVILNELKWQWLYKFCYGMLEYMYDNKG